MTLEISWQQGKELPTYTKGGAMGLVDGAPVYACGMTYPWRETEVAWWLDTERSEWYAVEPHIGLGRCYTHGVSLRDGLLVLGGRKSTAAGRLSLADAWWLRRQDGVFSWTELPAMNYGRALPAIGVSHDRVLVLGGGEWEKSQGGAFTTRHLQHYELLDLDDLDSGWRVGGPLPFTPLVGSAFASTSNAFYLFGGYECWTESGRCHITRHAGTWKYDFTDDTWIRLADCPVAGSGWCAACCDQTIFLLGGNYRSGPGEAPSHTFHTLDVGTPRQRLVGAYSDLVFAYDIARDAYRVLDRRMPIGLNDLRCTTDGLTIWAAGGETVDPALSNTINSVMVGVLDPG